MAKTIVENMEKEKSTGNLELGMVGENESLTAGVTEEVNPKELEVEALPRGQESLEGLNLHEPSALKDSETPERNFPLKT